MTKNERDRMFHGFVALLLLGAIGVGLMAILKTGLLPSVETWSWWWVWSPMSLPLVVASVAIAWGVMRGVIEVVRR